MVKSTRELSRRLARLGAPLALLTSSTQLLDLGAKIDAFARSVVALHFCLVNACSRKHFSSTRYSCRRNRSSSVSIVSRRSIRKQKQKQHYDNRCARVSCCVRCFAPNCRSIDRSHTTHINPLSFSLFSHYANTESTTGARGGLFGAGGRFKGGTDPIMEKFNESIHFDKRYVCMDGCAVIIG
jgi:hypothetical protein